MAQELSAKLTYEDYLHLPDDGKRYEIIDGVLYVSPSPNIKHQRVVRDLFRALDSFVLAHKLGEVFFAPCDVVMSGIDIVQPDILYISAARMEIITKANVKGVPDLVVEVLSKGTRSHDEVRKLKRYDHFGVAEYWIADPEIDTFKIYRRAGGAFAVIHDVTTINTPLLPDFSLDVRDVFAE